MRKRLLRGRNQRAAVVVLLVVLIGATVWLVASRTRDDQSAGTPPGCHVSLDSTTYTLNIEQAAHATTIAAVGKRMGMTDHAVTVAITAALQESRLHNLDHGDRDSLGLFQQRPSQGWGTAGQVMTPHYAAGAFYRRLGRINGWEGMPVASAAQSVQRSGAPAAYAQWEQEARAIAQATTGEIPAGMTCRVDGSPVANAPGALRASIVRELGTPALDAPLPDAPGWTAATWLVGHSTQFGIDSVAYAGQVWTPSSGRWVASGGPPDTHVRISEARA
jgi:hypothetical protein